MLGIKIPSSFHLICKRQEAVFKSRPNHGESRLAPRDPAGRDWVEGGGVEGGLMVPRHPRATSWLAGPIHHGAPGGRPPPDIPTSGAGADIQASITTPRTHLNPICPRPIPSHSALAPTSTLLPPSPPPIYQTQPITPGPPVH